MLFTRKGDDGKTKVFDCDQRFSKSSTIAEALGALDEVNSFLGICKIKASKSEYVVLDEKIDDIVHKAQKDLFIIQAQVAGADKDIEEGKVLWLENIINEIESELPPVNSFFISGGSDEGANFDFARTLVRRAERRTVAVSEEGKVEISKNTLSYMNRLSSLFYALARFVNFKSGISEDSPDYK